MHGFIHAKAFTIWPVQDVPRVRYLLAVKKSDELSVLGFRRRLRAIDQRAQWKPDPRDHHRPSFNAAMAIDALFERREFHQRIDVDDLRLLDFAFDPDRPRTRLEGAGILRGIILISPELVVVV